MKSCYVITFFIFLAITRGGTETIVDLQGNFTEDDVESWIASKFNSSSKISICNSTTIMGGVGNWQNNSTLTKKYNLTQPHNMIIIKLSLYMIDTLDNDDIFKLFVDENLIYTLNPTDFNNRPSDLCGIGTYKEEIYQMEIYLPHSKPEIKLTLTSDQDSNTDNEAWGFGDLMISSFISKIQTDLDGVLTSSSISS